MYVCLYITLYNILIFNYIRTHTHTYLQHYYVRPASLPQRQGGHCGRYCRMWRSGYGKKFVLCARVSACALRMCVCEQVCVFVYVTQSGSSTCILLSLSLSLSLSVSSVSVYVTLSGASTWTTTFLRLRNSSQISHKSVPRRNRVVSCAEY